MRLVKLAAVLAAVLGATVAQSHATAVQFTFGNGSGAADGSTLNGSFLFDSDTQTYSNINVTATGGTLGNLSFVTADTPRPGSFPSANRVFLLTGSQADFTGLFALDLGFANPLDMAGVFTPALFGALYECENSNCEFTGFDNNAFGIGVATSLVGTEVPLPGAIWAFLAGLGGLAAAKRKRKTAAV